MTWDMKEVLADFATVARLAGDIGGRRHLHRGTAGIPHGG